MRYSKILSFLFLLATIVGTSAQAVRNDKFVLVIDAGHGGRDAGAVGSFSKEKDINLNVALEFGRLVEVNNSDVKVIYTRKTDVFVPLQERADIANRNKADLFVSIHTNSLPAGRLAYGAETYTLGMARATANLEVAKRENSVISFESDYQQRYQGFDPNKAESYVIFEFVQDKHMKQSVDLATAIQRNYVKNGRKDKGVHQAGFLVLRQTSMPSVLTELGFISTPDEERYLNSRNGIEELARSIYNGFATYKNSLDKQGPRAPIIDNNFKGQENYSYVLQNPAEGEKTIVAPKGNDAQAEQSGSAESPAMTVSMPVKNPDKPEFRVQVLVVDRPLKTGDARLKGLAPNYYQEGTQYKYTYGSTSNYTEALRLYHQVKANFPDAFIIALKDGKRMDLVQARREASKK